jgi:hypothetical protein
MIPPKNRLSSTGSIWIHAITHADREHAGFAHLPPDISPEECTDIESCKKFHGGIVGVLSPWEPFAVIQNDNGQISVHWKSKVQVKSGPGYSIYKSR